MNIDIRKNVINNLKNESISSLIETINNAVLTKKDELVLPGLGVVLELFWENLIKEEKEKISTTISEGAKETNFNYITNSLTSLNSNISESYNSYFQTDFIFDTNFFTRNLETFTSLTFLSDGLIIYPPRKTQMIPYFK